MSRILQTGGGGLIQGQGDLARLSQSNVGSNGTASPRVFLQRDYRLGVAIRFMKDFPPELTGRIDPHAFDFTITELNALFEEAENFDCATFCESCLGFFTANVLWLCKDSKYERCIKRISKFVADQNQRVYVPRGLYITDPVERGLRCIEINILSEPQRS